MSMNLILDFEDLPSFELRQTPTNLTYAVLSLPTKEEQLVAYVEWVVGEMIADLAEKQFSTALDSWDLWKTHDAVLHIEALRNAIRCAQDHGVAWSFSMI